jgi:hypothetical protein
MSIFSVNEMRISFDVGDEISLSMLALKFFSLEISFLSPTLDDIKASIELIENDDVTSKILMANAISLVFEDFFEMSNLTDVNVAEMA